MKHIVKLSSEEFGDEFFAYDSRRDALAGMARLAEECARQNDGVERRIALVVEESPEESEQENQSAFACPKCGTDEINELTVCVVSHPVKTWSTGGDPSSYGNPIVDWQSDYPYSVVGGGESKITFECSNCMAQFEHPKRRD